MNFATSNVFHYLFTVLLHRQKAASSLCQRRVSVQVQGAKNLICTKDTVCTKC